MTGSAATGEGRAFVELTFDAHSGPSGENPTGTVSFDALLVDLGNLEVSCHQGACIRFVLRQPR